jgi:hypothetical protein
LFEVQTQHDASSYFFVNGASKQSLHLLINVGSESQNLVERWPRKWRSQLFRGNLLNERDVIAVEEAMKLFAKGL